MLYDSRFSNKLKQNQLKMPLYLIALKMISVPVPQDWWLSGMRTNAKTLSTFLSSVATNVKWLKNMGQ